MSATDGADGSQGLQEGLAEKPESGSQEDLRDSEEAADPTDPEYSANVDGASIERMAEELSASVSDAHANSVYLQGLMDEVSQNGGGVIRIPEGSFYFAATAFHEQGDYAIEARDNVKIVGAGQNRTVLKPMGVWAETGLFEHGVDMFAYFGTDTGTYLVNADFQDFTIDASETRGNPHAYNASGKGFFFKLFKECDWLNVTVMNTDGTGFGVDFPIASTMQNCTAVGCGKNAGPYDVGASGFGIGTGYSNRESLSIVGCASYDNTKYGFFFEHQTRFDSGADAMRGQRFLVVDCKASGNLYNFGGARAHDVIYLRCVSAVSADAEREAYTARAFCFENHSCRIEVTNCVVEQRYADVSESADYFQATQWALSESLLESGSSDQGAMLFHPAEDMLRSEAVVLLWRYSGRPGDVVYDYSPIMPDGYGDIAEIDYYIDAALWMRSIGDATLEEFRGDNAVVRAELVTMFWRMAGKPQASQMHSFEDVPEDSFYAMAVSWAFELGLVEGSGSAFGPYDTCSRAEVVMMLHAYDALMS